MDPDLFVKFTNLRYFDFEENHEVNCIIEAVDPASNCKSKFTQSRINQNKKKNKRYGILAKGSYSNNNNRRKRDG